MARPFRQPLGFENGYWPTAGLAGRERVPNSIADGQNFLMLGPGLMKTAKGMLAVTQPGGNRLYLVGSNIQAIVGSGTGSIVPYTSDSYWYLTDGAQPTINTGGASSIVLADTTGALKYRIGSTEFTAGLTAPAKLVLNAASAGLAAAGAGILNGDYAFKYTRIRSATGAESNGSDPSDVISVANKMVTINFPATVAGQDMWGIYATPAGAATNGPFLFLKNVTSSNTSHTFEFTSSQLGSLNPPTNNNVPPKGKFVATIGPTMVIIGTLGGNNTNVYAGVSPSKANNPEAYPFSFTTFLNPAESVIGFAARPTEGELILWTANSLQSLLFTGSDRTPIVSRAIWPLTGIMSPHGGCFADSQFYGFCGPSGPVRLGSEGDPDSRFAQPVREKMRLDGWDPSKVVVGWDAMEDGVVYIYQNTALVYNRSLEKWSPPVNLNIAGPAVAAITVGGQLYISFQGANGLTLAKWEQGTIPQSAFLQMAWQEAPDGQDRKTLIGYRATFDADSSNFVCDLLLDLDDTPVANGSLTTAGSMMSTLPNQTIWKRLNKKCRYYTLKISTMGADKYFYDAEFALLYEPNVREKK